MEKKIDLHVHTNYSDGSFEPMKCVEMAIDENIGIMAITDHSTFEGVQEAINDAKDMPIKIIAGIELFTKHPCNFHILCYFKNADFLKLQPYIFERNNEDTLVTIDTAISKLKENKIKCNLSKLRKFAIKMNHGIFGIFEGLCRQGLFQSAYIAQKALFDEGKICHFDDCFTITELIKRVREVGGSVFIAHPISYNLDLEDFKQVLPELIESGIDGLELYHCTSTPEKIKEIKKLCKKYSLLYSGGSDFHGPARGNAQLGHYYGHKPLTSELFWNIFAR